MNKNLPTFSIRNHLGHEVGTVETGGDPISAYACKVDASGSKLRKAGYQAVLISKKSEDNLSRK